jgi:hypothetical protein
MAKAKPPFATEAELCARFLSAIDKKEWTAYSETAGWDILLSRNADGFQIGIEAKLKFNALVLNQALENSEWSVCNNGPDCRAVLVPRGEANNLGRIADYIGIVVIGVSLDTYDAVKWFPRFSPDLPRLDGSWYTNRWPEWAPHTRHTLPEYVPDVEAGKPSPLQLTKWKIAAIKIAVTLDKRGFVTRHDFKVHGIDHRRWITKGAEWLVNNAAGYVKGPRFPDFRAQHPVNYAQIEANAAKWMPDLPPLYVSKAA